MVDSGHLDAFVIESNPEIGLHLKQVLTSAGYASYVVAGDRPLIAMPEWSGPSILLIGIDDDLSRRRGYARRIQALYPQMVVIGYSVEFTADVLEAAMAAGARRLLQLPISVEALKRAVVEAREELETLTGTIDALTKMRLEQPEQLAPEPSGAAAPEKSHRTIVVFSPKGGVGTSTLAVNLAAALQVTGHPAALVDGNLSFGSHDVFLNLPPSRSMLQLAGDAEQMTGDAVAEALTRHSTGLQVLLAPLQPEEGDRVRPTHIKRMLELLRQRFSFTVVDTWPGFDDRVLAMLECGDIILVPFGPDMPAMKNLHTFLRVASLLNYDESRIIPVLMRADSVAPGYILDIEGFLKKELRWRVVSDGKRATQAATAGTPFVLGARDAQISRNIYELARFLAGDPEPRSEAAVAGKLPAAGKMFWKR
jgi:pilus assembly protein CpaE